MTTFGVYVHIPFCPTRCTFCTFVTRPWQPEVARRYARAVVQEIERFFEGAVVDGAADTIYFGGGTPSMMPASDIAEMLGACRDRVEVTPDAEITLEANPGTLSPAALDLYRASGVSRISLGAESFDDAELAATDRGHTAAETAFSFELLRAHGFDNINLDLIAGLPGQTASSFGASCRAAIALEPEHLSLYMLELDSKAPLYHGIAAGTSALPDEDAVAEWYLEARRTIESAGLGHYEISNFARRGCESRHNLKYWRREPVYAFGVGSHAFDGRARWANTPSTDAYLAAVEGGRDPVEWRQDIGADASLEEALFLGLRLRSGVDWEALAREHSAARLRRFEPALDKLERDGLLEREAKYLRLTERGILLSNEVFQTFV